MPDIYQNRNGVAVPVQKAGGLSPEAAALIESASDTAAAAETTASAAQSTATAAKTNADKVPGIVARIEALEASLKATLADPWSIFPPRVPIVVDGVTFPTGANARHPIMPGETTPRLNWVICDGGADGKGGTMPDMRDRMIMGAGPKHPAGSKGGSETHTHSVSGTVGATTLTEAQLASHNHPGILMNGSGWGHGIGVINNEVYFLDAVGITGSSQSHIHTMTASSGASASLPPYYALAYIMRVS